VAAPARQPRLHVRPRLVVRRQLRSAKDRYSPPGAGGDERILRQDRNFFDAASRRPASTTTSSTSRWWCVTSDHHRRSASQERGEPADGRPQTPTCSGPARISPSSTNATWIARGSRRYRDPASRAPRAPEAWLVENDAYLPTRHPPSVLRPRPAAPPAFTYNHVSVRIRPSPAPGQLSAASRAARRRHLALPGWLDYDEHRFEPASGHEASVATGSPSPTHDWGRSRTRI
jgi:hypothetical protein